MEPSPVPSDETKKPNVLEFITFTDIHQTNARETKKKVRGHIMRGRQRALKEARVGTEKDAKFVLDTSPLFGPARSGRIKNCALLSHQGNAMLFDSQLLVVISFLDNDCCTRCCGFNCRLDTLAGCDGNRFRPVVIGSRTN